MTTPPRCVQSSCQIGPGHEGHSGHQVLEVEGGLIELEFFFPEFLGTFALIPLGLAF